MWFVDEEVDVDVDVEVVDGNGEGEVEAVEVDTWWRWLWMDANGEEGFVEGWWRFGGGVRGGGWGRM